jgi:alpha-mannosidase
MLNGIFDKSTAAKYKNNIDSAYENCILFGEHTWGLTTFNYKYMGYGRDYKKGKLNKNGDVEKYELSWDEHRDYYYNARKELDEIKPEVLNHIAGSVNVEGPRFTICSSLGWKRDAWVDVDAFREQIDSKQLVDTTNNKTLESVDFNGKLHVHVPELPAFGYKTLVLKETASVSVKKTEILCDPEHGLLENWWYRIIADPVSGTIESLKDKSTGHEWVGEYGQAGFGQYHYDIYSGDEATQFLVDSSVRFYDWQVNQLVRKEYFDQEHLNFVPGRFTIEGKTGDKSATIIMKAKISDESVKEYGNIKELITEITIYEDQPYIDMQYYLKDKEKTFCVEAGHFVFPLNLKKSQVNINKLGSVINPAVDIIKGSNHNLYCCENWVDVTDGEQGMAVIPFDTQLFSIGSHGIVKCRREYVKEEPILFFNAFNNSYGCNFPQWMGGDYSFRYRLIPHEGDWKKGDIAKRAFESMAPPLVGFSTGAEANGNLPANFWLIEELDGIELLAFKPAENGQGYILRLREITGEKHEAKLTLSQDLKCISKCDILERILENLIVKDNAIQFEIKPFEVLSFYLKP